jgi:hypothetical protein
VIYPTPQVRQITYTSNTSEDNNLYPIELIIKRQTDERLAEAKANRLFRASPADHDERRRPGWSTRARNRLGDTLVAAGETLRSSPDELPAAHSHRAAY